MNSKFNCNIQGNPRQTNKQIYFILSHFSCFFSVHESCCNRDLYYRLKILLQKNFAKLICANSWECGILHKVNSGLRALKSESCAGMVRIFCVKVALKFADEIWACLKWCKKWEERFENWGAILKLRDEIFWIFRSFFLLF